MAKRIPFVNWLGGGVDVVSVRGDMTYRIYHWHSYPPAKPPVTKAVRILLLFGLLFQDG